MQTIHLHGVPAGGLVGLKPQLSKKEKKKKKNKTKRHTKKLFRPKRIYDTQGVLVLMGFLREKFTEPI